MHLPPSREAVAAPDLPTGTGSYGRELTFEPTGTASTARPRRRVVVLAGLGLLIGAMLAVGGSWVAAQLRGTPTDQSGPVLPTLGPGVTNLPSGAITYQVNPAIAPAITRLEADATSVFVQWEDPTGGQAAFIVVRSAGSESEAVATPEPGTTELLRNDLPPADAPYCYYIISVMTTERGISQTVCAE